MNIRPVITYTLLTAAIVSFSACQKPKPQTAACSAGELAVCGQEVSKRLAEISGDIRSRLSAFADEVAADQLFSLRLLAEDNRSAPEVTAKAGQFLRPMGFSILTILDSSSTILSSGDFPASAGNSALRKAVLLGGEPKVIVDQVMGKTVVTLQSKAAVRIVDSIPVYAMGGIVIDEAFLARLSVREGVVVLLKQGSDVIGMPGVRTISDVKDGRIVINDKEYGAVRLALPFAGEGEEPALIAVLKTDAESPK